MRFGRQRPWSDLTAITLLFLGFCALGVALWIYRGTWAGALLPLAFVIGAYAGLRTEVREVELRDDALLVKTFLRAYPLPRAHVIGVMRTENGVAVEVLSGVRYDITPQGVDIETMFDAVRAWLS